MARNAPRALVATVVVAVSIALLTSAASAGTNVLDIVQNGLTSATTPIRQNAAQWSSTLFFGLVGLEFLYLLYRGMFMSDWGELLNGWVDRICKFGLGALIVQNQLALADGATQLIGRIGSSFVTDRGANVTPGYLASLGWQLSLDICNISTGNPLADLGVFVSQQIAGLVTTFSFFGIALEALAVNVGCQFAIALAGISVGLMATRWTIPFASTLPRVIFSTLIVTVAVLAMAGMGYHVAQYDDGLIQTAATGAIGGNLMNDFLTVSAVSVGYGVLSLFIPALIGFLGATSPLPGGSAVGTYLASRLAIAAGRSSSGSKDAGGRQTGPSSIAAIEAAGKTS